MLSDLCIRRPIFATVLSILIVLAGIVAVAVPQYHPSNRHHLNSVRRRQRPDAGPYSGRTD